VNLELKSARRIHRKTGCQLPAWYHRPNRKDKALHRMPGKTELRHDCPDGIGYTARPVLSSKAVNLITLWWFAHWERSSQSRATWQARR
jgi:hypothetical protein